MAVGFKSGGRQKGSLNKATLAVRNAGKVAPPDHKSLGHMRRIAHWFMTKAEEAEAKKDAKGNPDPDLPAASHFYHEAVGVLKNIAEYEFSKLQAITVSGDPNRPQITKIEVELVPSRFERIERDAKLIEAKPA